MSEQDLQIDLRRRFVEQAQRRRAHLTQNLRQLGAVGPVTRPLTERHRQAFVKVGITKGSTTGKHLSYLTHAKGPDKQDATLFGPGAADKPQFVQAAQHDRHQFRIVVSVPEHRFLDRTRYIELFMAQVERDLGRPLEWMAAHHSDTPYPHTHIVLRGQDHHGKDLYMERHYLTQGLRARASALLTWMLGPVRHQQQFIQSDRQAFDGVLRGLDDPDSRTRAQQSAIAANTYDPRPLRTQTQDVRSPAEILAEVRRCLQPSPERRREAPLDRQQPDAARPVLGSSLADASLMARLAALHQALQAQQRGQGMGW